MSRQCRRTISVTARHYILAKRIAAVTSEPLSKLVERLLLAELQRLGLPDIELEEARHLVLAGLAAARRRQQSDVIESQSVTF